MKNEVARLKSRLSQQERMLCGAVKRLRTTNQLKEGMEKMIIDQCKILFFDAYPGQAKQKMRCEFFSPPLSSVCNPRSTEESPREFGGRFT